MSKKLINLWGNFFLTSEQIKVSQKQGKRARKLLDYYDWISKIPCPSKCLWHEAQVSGISPRLSHPVSQAHGCSSLRTSCRSWVWPPDMSNFPTESRKQERTVRSVRSTPRQLCAKLEGANQPKIMRGNKRTEWGVIWLKKKCKKIGPKFCHYNFRRSRTRKLQWCACAGFARRTKRNGLELDSERPFRFWK